MKAFEYYNNINSLPTLQEKHRAWLKLREGLKFGRGVDGHYKKGEEWTKSEYRDSAFTLDINLVGRLPNETRIEFDGDETEAKKFLEEIKNKLQEKRWGYIRSTHKGKSDYLWIQFNRKVSDKEIKKFLEWIAPIGSTIDENFASSEKIFPCMYAVHWKHSYQRELPIEFFEGEQIDYDSLGLTQKKTNTSNNSFEYETFKKSMNIFTDKIELANIFYDKQPIFYDKAGMFWLWDFESKSWIMKDETDVMNLIYTSCQANTINSKERNEILQALKQVGRLKQPKELPKTWIQFNNGIIDINNEGVIIESTPEYFTVNPIPHNIGSTSDTPNMDRIFEQWVGKDHVKTLYQILAYSILPNYPIHRLFCFIGEGMNGKSKFLDLLRRFVGDSNVTATELDVLLSSRFEVTRLYKKLICQMGETNFSEMNKTSILKKLTGQDLIGFEYKNKTPFEASNYAKIIISTNNLPTTSDKTIGFYRRWLIIDFPNRFTEKKDILAEIPDEEYDNLALKSISVLRELLQNKEFHNEGSIEERIKRYEDHSDPLEKFMKEFTTDSPDGYIWKFEFEKRLNQWCKENKFRQMSEVAIGKKMKEKGITQTQKMSDWFIEGSHKLLRAWIGIKWVGNSQDSQDSQANPTQITCREKELELPVNLVNPVNKSCGREMIIDNEPILCGQLLANGQRFLCNRCKIMEDEDEM